MRLRQILNNFVSNALKFTEKGRIEIRADLVWRADGEERVRFSVTDTGIGISEEDQARLFQPFVQAAGEITPRFGGTGLGLTICKRLAQMMGGSIGMLSQVGAGTTMTLELTLPIADPKELIATDPVNAYSVPHTTETRRTAPDTARAEAEGTLALLADDHPTNRSLIVRQINMLGYAAESAENGIVALEKWKSGRFGILITDCNMPEMNGYELTRRIRALRSYERQQAHADHRLHGERAGWRGGDLLCRRHGRLSGETCRNARVGEKSSINGCRSRDLPRRSIGRSWRALRAAMWPPSAKF